MLNQTILLKVKLRLNKLASQDYDNIEDWKIIEAFNKAQVDWCRRNLHGNNLFKEGDEESKRRVDDLQILLKRVFLNMTDRETYQESEELPIDYMEYKRIGTNAKTDCCSDPRSMVIYLAEQDNVDLLLRDDVKKPSFDWAETFCTISGNKIQIYTNAEFELVNPYLIYYRQPIRIEIAGVATPYATAIPAVSTECEFKDDLVELFIDETVKILAGDIESFNQYEIASSKVEGNN